MFMILSHNPTSIIEAEFMENMHTHTADALTFLPLAVQRKTLANPADVRNVRRHVNYHRFLCDDVEETSRPICAIRPRKSKSVPFQAQDKHGYVFARLQSDSHHRSSVHVVHLNRISEVDHSVSASD